MSKRNVNFMLPMTSDPKVIEEWAEDMANLIMPSLLRRLDAILPDYICEQVLKHINYPMDFHQAAFLLNMNVETLRKKELRGHITFSKKNGRKMITLQDLCKQLGNSVILQQIKNKH